MKSRFFLFLLSFLFLWCSVAGAQTRGGEFAGGDGTVDKPFLIETKYHLRNLNRYLGEHRSGKHFKLVRDIVFDKADFEWGGDFYNAGKGWVPIGENEGNSFRGHVFDGNGFAVIGLYSSRDMYAGLFGYVYGSTIRNLYLLDCRIVLGDNVYRPHAGMLLAIMHKEGRVEHCYCEGEIVTKGWDESCVGGIAGEISGSAIVNSYARVEIRKDASGKEGERRYCVGGIAGMMIFGSAIRNCYADVDLSGANAFVGGITGCIWEWERRGGDVKNCYVRGSLYSGYALGGIAAENFIAAFKGNCVLLSRMEGKGLKKNSAGLADIAGIASMTDGGTIFQHNYVSEKVGIKVASEFRLNNDENGNDGAFCREKPDLAFWQKLGFAFGDTPEAPWVLSSSGYPVIYGFENLSSIHLRIIPDTTLGKRYKEICGKFSENRKKCEKKRSEEMASRMTRVNASYKKDLENELKKNEAENWILASAIKKELDALNSGKVEEQIDSGLTEIVGGMKTTYLRERAKAGEEAGRWDDAFLMLKEKYRDELVAIQKECLASNDLKLASLVEKELNKL